MRKIFCFATVCLPLLAFSAEFKFPNHTFTVPDGFEVELVAGPPLIDRPISADFDEQGRLYVTDSSGSNEKPDKQLLNPTHRIVRLEDTDNDGRFDQSVVFADKLPFPEGAMWFDGALYVAAPPSIWKLTDTDGDGKADHREEWFQGKTLTGCANDLHGPYLGPDGYIYWTKGAFSEQTHTLGNGRKLNDRAAHIYRARPDGSNLDVIMSGGMDNPVEVAFTPEGEAIFTSTFIDFSQPGFRDGIAHAAYGAVFGKQNDLLEDGRVKRTGPDLMHPFYQAGNAAECGLCRYESAVFGADYRDNLFATAFNLRKVTRHILRPNGATYASTDSDFLVSDNLDFHPTDALEDADGSLLVIDTGGWYKLCCPSSQLAKADVLGAIYRVRRSGAPKVNDPRGVNLAWSTMKPAPLAKLLGDERPAVRNLAIRTLGKIGQPAVPVLREAALESINNIKGRNVDLKLTQLLGTETRRNAVWALTHIEGAAAREVVRAALADPDQSVRLAAMHSTTLWRDAGAISQLMDLLQSGSAHVKRSAAEALGRIGDKRAVPILLAATQPPESGTPNDRVLDNSLTYALIEIADRDSTRASLRAASSLTRRASLIALDQMDGGDLKVGDVAPLLASTDPALKQTAAWIAGHHPAWGKDLAGFFQERLTVKSFPAAERDELQRQLAQFARDPAIRGLLAATLSDAATPAATRQLVLRAMGQTSLKETPGEWAKPLRQALAEANEPIVRAAVAAVRSLPVAKTNAIDFSERLLRVAGDAARPTDLRLDALAAIPGGLSPVEPAIFELLRGGVEPAQSPLQRSAAASVLGRSKLNEAQLLSLADSLKTTGPLEISKLLSAFEVITNETVGSKLVAALKESKGLAGLRAELLKPRLEKFPTSVQEEAKALLAQMSVDLERQKSHLEALLGSLKSGDVRRGQLVFNSPKTACATCHAIGYLGGKTGPDLTTIGQIRNERDLLEAIIYPSASFVRSYEPMVIVTKSGEDYNGVLRKDAADEVVLATGPEVEVRLARTDIAEMRPGTVSIMPGGLDEQLSKQELADLVAFLKGTKWGPQ